MSMALVSAAENNSTISDDLPLQSIENEAISIDSDNQTINEEDVSEGYIDPSEAYECLNEFRTEDGAWFWAPNNVRIVYFNTHEANQLKPFLIDPELEKTAQIRAKEISQYFEHERPDGTMCFDIYPDFFTCGENIAIASTGKEATEAWKEDFLPFVEQGHRRNMLNDAFQYVGIAGYRDSNGVAYWVQAFGGNYTEPTYFDDKTQKDESKGTFDELNNLIASTDMISLDKDYEYFNDSALVQGILISKSLTFNGNGHSIDAKGFARIFNVSADNVVIKNTRFLNAYVDYIHGGAIYSGNFNLTLINCSFINNFAYYGAAVSSTGGHLNLFDCEFGDNWAVEGTLYAENTTVELINCIFKNNSAILYGAGACLNDANASLMDCVFKDSVAGLKGGALSSINSNITNNDSIFARNNACLEGGAICILNATIANSNCNFSNNTLTSTYYAFGAALYGENSTISCSECSFSENWMNSEFWSANGGALYLLRGDSSLNGCNFTDNSAKIFGGALCLINNTAIVNRCKFNRNALDNGNYVSNGGAIYCECTDISVDDSSFMNNFAHNGAAINMASSNIQLNGSAFSNNFAALNGGALYSKDGNATVDKSEFLNNSAVFSGGALFLGNGNVLCTDLIFRENNGTYGGALHFENAGFSIIKNNFEDNLVDHDYATFGGAVHLSACEGSLEQCSFTKNRAYSNDYINSGAAVCFEDSNVSVEDCNFTKNMAYRGIVYANKGNISINNCRFSKDNATGAGIVYMTGAFASISNCIFSDEVSDNSVAYLGEGVFNIINSEFTNISSKNSGGVCAYQSEISIEECDFSDISCSADYYSNGGAVFLNYCDVFISKSSFTNNSATNYGGALYLSSCRGSVENSCFSANTINSTNFYVYAGALYSSNGNINVSNCIFTDNSICGDVYVKGGAIALFDGNSSLVNCTFTSNTANSGNSLGGALYCGNGNVSITDSRFDKNSAVFGAAFALENSNVTIINSKFLNNSAGHNAGALYLDACNCEVVSSDFSNNHANYGGAICLYSSDMSVATSSFTNNTALSGGAIYSAWGNSIVIGSNFTDNAAEQNGGALYSCDAIDSTFENNFAETAGAIYGENNNATNCRFIKNVAYHDSPTHDVNAKDCTFTDNSLITRAKIDVSYVGHEYYQTDIMYVQLCLSDYPYQPITNATLTIRLYRDDVFVDEFNFSSGDYGWIVNASEGQYFAELSIESEDFEVNPVNVTFNVLKKEIATADITFANYTFSNPVVIGFKSNVDAYAEIYIDDAYIDYQEMAGNESINLTYTYIQAGSHIFKAVLTPKNSKIDPVTITGEFEVFKKETFIVLDVGDVTTAENLVVVVLSSDDGNVVVKVGDVTQSVQLYANQSTQIFMGSLDAGEYSVEAVFSAGENYLSSSVSKNITVKKVVVAVVVDIVNVTFPDQTVVDIQSNVDASAEVYIDEMYVESFDLTANETRQLAYSNIQAGSHNFKVVLTPVNYRLSQFTEIREFTVFKKETSIRLDVADITDKENVIVSVQASEEGEVSVRIGNIVKSIHVNANQKSQIDFGIISGGEYVVEATFDAGENYVASNDSKVLNVLKKITQEDIKIFKGDSKNIVINLPGDATGTVRLTIAGQNYDVEIINGTADVTLPDLGSGDYPYAITYSGDEKYAAFSIDGNLNQNSSDESPKIKPDITIPEFKDGSKVELPGDAKGTVTLTVDGKDYVFEVVNGIADVKLPDMANGAHEYIIAYSGDGKYSSFTQAGSMVVERPIVITAGNVKVTYGAGSYYIITVKNDANLACEGVEVDIKVNGKTFKTLSTDSNGMCSFKVSNIPGTYKLTITSEAKSVTQTLTVKHLVTLKSVTVKRSAKKLVLTATLAKINNKYLKNKKITFKFNGKKYTAKTDKKGVAKVTIKSSVLKKLKVGKKLTYQATYSKDTVKKTVKIKK